MNAVEYAVAMEADGEKYYRTQAALNQNNSLGVVCQLLADAEQAHARLLRNRKEMLSYTLPGKTEYMDLKNVFDDAKSFQSTIRETPNQLEFYRTALELEQKSIDLYTKLLSGTAERSEQDLFQFLVSEETRHFAFLDALVTMLRHAEEWVESAEFGLRKEIY